MATRSLTLNAQYGSGYDYGAWTTAGSNNGDYNRFYVGGSSTRGRTRFKFTIPADLPANPTSVTIMMKTDESNCTPSAMRAFLSTNASVNSDVDVWINAGAILKTSYWYTNEACTSRVPLHSYVYNPIYTRIDYNFVRGTTYYVGLFPYYSDSDANTNTDYASVWFRGQNNSGYLSAYCTYTLPTYTVSYNANGGSGAPSSQTKTYGVTLTLSSTKPTRTSVKDTFTITGNGNGGTTKTVTATKTTSYTFAGWATSASGSVVYAAGASYTANAAVTLYAVWTSSVSYSNNTIAALGTTTRADGANGFFQVTFDPNGGVCGTDFDRATRKISYSFLGWGASSAATSSLASNTAYTTAATVYARWSSSGYTLSISLPTPTRAGYEFVGWAEDKSAESGVTGTYTPSNNVTLYAIWEPSGLIHLYDGSSWRDGLVWVFDGAVWRQGIPWCYDGTAWRIGG